MNEAALSIASLWASQHILRIMVNRGLVSPNEVDEVHGSILEAMEMADPAFATTVTGPLEAAFVELKQTAESLWIGKGKTNPR